MHIYYSVMGFHNCIESCQPCPAWMGLLKQGKSPLFRKGCLHIIYFLTKEFYHLFWIQFPPFSFYLLPASVYNSAHQQCNPKINSQNFCEDVNSKIDYFLSLGYGRMEEK